MNNFTLTTPQGNKKIKIPQGRHEVSYSQWMEAYKYIMLGEEAQQDLDNNEHAKASRKAIESMARIVSALSNAEYKDVINLTPDKLNNLFLLYFDWLNKELPKKEHKIKNRIFVIPDFTKGSAGDFMDSMDLLGMVEDSKNDIELGLTIASVYLKEKKDKGEYKQDLEEIEKTKQFIKDNAKMDVLYSCAFFFLNFSKDLKPLIQQPLEVREELEKLISNLNGWVTILYSQVSQKVDY